MERSMNSEQKNAAFQMMKNFMEQYKDYGFHSVISLGDIQKYKNLLDSVDLKIDENIKSEAKYSPKLIFGPSITLNTDPLQD